MLGTARMALVALRRNLLRSLLAMFGIVIGVGSVIIMVAIGNGAKDRVDAQIRALGADTLQITPGSIGVDGRQGGAGTAPPFSEEDVTAIRNQVPGIAAISALVPGNAAITYGAVNWTTQVIGVDQGYFDVRGWGLGEGRVFSPAEALAGAKVAILGRSASKRLFGENSPLGEMARIRGVPFQIIGVLEEKGQTSVGADQDDVILVPAVAARRRLFGSYRFPNVVRSISLKLEDAREMPLLQADMEALLRQRRHIGAGKQDNFRVQSMAEFVRARADTQSTLSLLLAATAAISFIVGGFGIMNIMLVSVSERTREIGLRMAVGAKSRDILGQFLIEAAALCGSGGVVGILIGAAGAIAMSRLGAWEVSLEPTMVIEALLSAALVGVFFGFYPARKASRLNPIEALRRE